MSRAPLAGTLAFLLPEPPAAALLAVCLAPARARAAWRAWERAGGDLDDHRSLLPLVDEGVRRGGVDLPDPVAARLRGARLHEALRAARIREIAAAALDALAAAGHEPIVLQDVALAETAYGDPALRHSRALDLLLPPGAAGRAAAALAEAGFARRPGRPGHEAERELADPSGFPVRLGEAAVRGLGVADVAGPVRARAVPARIGDRPARVAAPGDLLAIACGRAATSADRRTLLWACDAATLVGSNPSLDWDLVLGTVDDLGLALPVAAMLGWLAGELDVGVPGEAVAALERRGRGRPVEPALACVRADGRATPAALLRRARGWRERWAVLRWTAFPSRARMRRAYPGLPLPLAWLARPLRRAARAVTPARRSSRARGSRAPGAGTAARRSGAPPAREAGRPSASRRS